MRGGPVHQGRPRDCRVPAQVSTPAVGQGRPGFHREKQRRGEGSAVGRGGLELVRRHLADPELKFLLLDELNIVLSYEYLPAAEVIEALRNKREDLHVVVTGRGALPALIEIADLVTEMKEIKHPFKEGIRAQPGIEF